MHGVTVSLDMDIKQDEVNTKSLYPRKKT